MEKIGLVSLGCPKNQSDAEIVMASLLQHSGRGLSTCDEELDTVVINTCSFLASARKEATETIAYYSLWKHQRPGRKIIVSGCLPAYEREAIRERFPEVDVFLSPHQIHDANNYLQDSINKSDALLTSGSSVTFAPRLLTTPAHYAYLKIADGCCHGCAFCLIPQIRGVYQSKHYDDILIEANELTQSGVKECIIVAQDTTAYGNDLKNGKTINDVLIALSTIDSLEWIRLMYAFPSGISAELVQLIKQTDRIVNYLDVPIQHVSASVLDQMGRPSSINWIDWLRWLKNEGMTVRTSVIVGFPGETDEDFNALYNIVGMGLIDKLGVFEFSPEPGTPAFNLKPTVSVRKKRQRRQALMGLQQTLSLQKNLKKVGTIVSVRMDTKTTGRLPEDAPDIDNLVTVKGAKKIDCGNLINIKIINASEYDLVGVKQ